MASTFLSFKTPNTLIAINFENTKEIQLVDPVTLTSLKKYEVI